MIRASGWTLPLWSASRSDDDRRTGCSARGAGRPAASRITAYVQGFLGQYTHKRGCFWARDEGWRLLGRARRGLRHHRPTTPSARWGRAELVRRSRRTTGRWVAFIPNFSDRWPIRRWPIPPSAPGSSETPGRKLLLPDGQDGAVRGPFRGGFWGAPIDCNQQGDPPAYRIWFKKLAVAVRSANAVGLPTRRIFCYNRCPTSGPGLKGRGKPA